jgi:hypothetical protein
MAGHSRRAWWHLLGDEMDGIERPGVVAPTSDELAEWHRRWDAVGPAAVAAALSSSKPNDLVDGYRRGSRKHNGVFAHNRQSAGPWLDACPHAQAWLVDHARRTKVREKRESWGRRLTLAMAVITAIAAIIATTPMMQGWLSTLFTGHS